MKHATRTTAVRPWVGELADWMDTRFRIPGTRIRFGLDPVIGFVPVLGDTATLLIGLAMLGEARRLGLSIAVQARILWNLVVDWFVGLIPGLDLILDTAVKAHSKNASLIHHHAGATRRHDVVSEQHVDDAGHPIASPS